MAWVVDTCLLIDVAIADPQFGAASARLLDQQRPSGLALCPISYIELSPLFNGDAITQNEFLFHVGVAPGDQWTSADTLESHQGWQRYVTRRRAGQAPKRPLADVLIGAFASRFEGLLTRNLNDFRHIYPQVTLISP